MFKFTEYNIRLRILLLTILTIIPFVLLIIYINIVQLQSAKDQEKNRLISSSRIAASEHAQIIEGARQLLISLSNSSELQFSGSNCSFYLNALLNKYKRYNNLALADLSGTVICNAAELPNQNLVNVSDRLFYRRALKDKDFSIGEYAISKTTNQPVLSFGYPLSNISGEIVGVIYSSLDLNWLGNLEVKLSLPSESLVFILDQNGKILTSNHATLIPGETFHSQQLINGLQKKDGFIEDNSNFGNFFYAFSQIGNSESSPYVVVGTPKSITYKAPNENFKKALLISSAIAIVSISSGLIIGNSLIAKIILAMEKVELLRKDFISLVSHQLRTPLTSIKYLSEILYTNQPGLLNPKQREFVKNINQSADRLISLVGTLLDISRFESDKYSLRLEKRSLTLLTFEAIKELSPVFKSKKISVLVKNPKGSIDTCVLDPRLIKQVISNLLSNAYKYSISGSIVKIIIRKNKNYTTYTIVNTGAKITKEETAQIFQKFYRGTHAIRSNAEGSGLGLYLSKLIIEAHKGTLQYKKMKKNHMFIFTLPSS